MKIKKSQLEKLIRESIAEAWPTDHKTFTVGSWMKKMESALQNKLGGRNVIVRKDGESHHGIIKKVAVTGGSSLVQLLFVDGGGIDLDFDTEVQIIG